MNSQETEEILSSLENIEWVFDENTMFYTSYIDLYFTDIPIAIPIFIVVGIPVIQYVPDIPLVQGIIIQDI